MTREEEVKNYLERIGRTEMANEAFDIGFTCGVEWADAHPHWMYIPAPPTSDKTSQVSGSSSEKPNNCKKGGEG